jgi:hypothetical protein
MTAVWITLGVGLTAIGLLVGWRLRKAAAKLDRILLEEESETESPLPTNDR